MKKQEKTSIDFRDAADKVWEMAKEYEESEHRDISNILKELASQLHELARNKEHQEAEADKKTN